MTLYFPYGLIAIGLSMYAFYVIRSKRKEITLQRRTELKDTRQEWLDHQLGMKKSHIILYGQFMQQKIQKLKEIGTNVKEFQVYYLDEASDEKWIKEYTEMNNKDSAQLRKIDQFPFE